MTCFAIRIAPVPHATLTLLEAGLETLCMAQSRFALPAPDTAPDAPQTIDCNVAQYWAQYSAQHWVVTGYAASAPDIVALAAMLAAVTAATGVTLPTPVVTPLLDTDWYDATRRAFPPQRVGRFFVRGSHIAGPTPPGLIALQIDAGLAFGTGEHPTTQGCLAALEHHHRHNGTRARPRLAVLDLGCGSAILAMAAAKLFGCRALAVDSDPSAIKAARVAVAANGLARRVTLQCANGYNHRTITRHAPFDLIFANILAQPLCALAAATAAHLAPGGLVVLSGLLARQETRILCAYRRVGLCLTRRIARDGWHTLMLRRAL